jgi:hypothetical protein
MNEGRICKGGVNKKPTIFPPNTPPIGQGGKMKAHESKEFERMENEEKRTPIFRIVPASAKDKANGFNFTLNMYWGGTAYEFVPIKHYKSKRKAVKELDLAIKNYLEDAVGLAGMWK